MNALNLSPSTWAKMMKTSAKPPFVIHIFSPFITKLPSPWRTARVFAPSASEPEPDSLRQYGADQFAGQQLRQVLALLRLRSEE